MINSKVITSTIKGTIHSKINYSAVVSERTTSIGAVLSETRPVNSYDDLTDKPRINNVELKGNISSLDLNIMDKDEYLTEQDIDRLLYGGFIDV